MTRSSTGKVLLTGSGSSWAGRRLQKLRGGEAAVGGAAWVGSGEPQRPPELHRRRQDLEGHGRLRRDLRGGWRR